MRAVSLAHCAIQRPSPLLASSLPASHCFGCKATAPRRMAELALRVRHLPQATAQEQEDQLIEEMKKQSEKPDPWEGETAGTGVKIAFAVGFLIVVSFLFNEALPMIENTIQSFPAR